MLRMDGRDPRQLAQTRPATNDDGQRQEPLRFILASKRDGVLYVGVTSDLYGRIAQHDQGLLEGFTKRYGVKELVYYETHDDMAAAILVLRSS